MYTLVEIYRSDSGTVEWVDVCFYDDYECVHQAMADEFMAFVGDDDFDTDLDGQCDNVIADYFARYVSGDDADCDWYCLWRIVKIPEDIVGAAR